MTGVWMRDEEWMRERCLGEREEGKTKCMGEAGRCRRKSERRLKKVER